MEADISRNQVHWFLLCWLALNALQCSKSLFDRPFVLNPPTQHGGNGFFLSHTNSRLLQNCVSTITNGRLPVIASTAWTCLILIDATSHRKSVFARITTHRCSFYSTLLLYIYIYLSIEKGNFGVFLVGVFYVCWSTLVCLFSDIYS